MENNNKFYVYVYLDPRKPGDYNYGEYHFDYEPFYVGKGCDDRMFDHLKPSYLKTNKNKTFTNKIKKIQRVCEINPIIIKYQCDLIEHIALKLEPAMIAVIGRKRCKTGPLCNITKGGTGCDTFTNNPNKEKIREKLRNHVVTEETKEKLRGRTGIKSNRFNKKHKKESIEKMIISQGKRDITGENNPFYGKTHTEETNQKNRECHTDKKGSEKQKNAVKTVNKLRWDSYRKNSIKEYYENPNYCNNCGKIIHFIIFPGCLQNCNPQLNLNVMNFPVN